jgi:hypothetical protein
MPSVIGFHTPTPHPRPRASRQTTSTLRGTDARFPHPNFGLEHRERRGAEFEIARREQVTDRALPVPENALCESVGVKLMLGMGSTPQCNCICLMLARSGSAPGTSRLACFITYVRAMRVAVRALCLMSSNSKSSNSTMTVQRSPVLLTQSQMNFFTAIPPRSDSRAARTTNCAVSSPRSRRSAICPATRPCHAVLF